MRARLVREFRFESAHRLPALPPEHKCTNIHGHTFRVEVTVEGEVDPVLGWIYDHAVISRAAEPLLQQLDHRLLNDVPGLENPTVENLAAWWWRKLEAECPGLCEIIIHETPTARCIFRGEF